MQPRNIIPAVGLAVAALTACQPAPAQTAPTAATTTAEATTPPPTVQPPAPIRAQPVSPQALRRLPKATTSGVIAKAPRDPAPGKPPSGLVVHPRRTVPVYARPGGPAIAAVPRTQVGAATWLPVIAERRGWLRVLLPARPNGATGWLAREGGQLQLARTRHRIEVDRGRFTVRLYRDGKPAGRWSAGVGKPSAVTPKGRTFVLAVIRDTKATFSDIVLPLGAHSDTHTTYGGGPGTVGIHTWPSADGISTASSDGCIRVPKSALRVFSTLPLGTPVLVR